MLTVVGRTEEGQVVLAGVYKTIETYGVPLDILLTGLQTQNAIPCWMSFYREAIAAGMKHERILAKLDEALSDVYGASFRDFVVKALETLHAKSLLK